MSDGQQVHVGKQGAKKDACIEKQENEGGWLLQETHSVSSQHIQKEGKDNFYPCFLDGEVNRAQCVVVGRVEYVDRLKLGNQPRPPWRRLQFGFGWLVGIPILLLNA